MHKTFQEQMSGCFFLYNFPVTSIWMELKSYVKKQVSLALEQHWCFLANGNTFY